MAEYYEYITGQGVIVPDTSTVLTDVQNMFREAFGADLDLTATTAQGRLIELFQRNRTFCIQICALVSNMLNLNRATGFVLDDLGSLFLIERQPAQPTYTTVILKGVPGTVIPEGTRLQTEDGYVFVNEQQYIIPQPANLGDEASVTARYRSVETGEIPCVPDTLTIMLDRINGLESATNPSPAELGRDLESDTEFRARIKESLNINSIAILSAIKSNLMAVNGVKDSFCYDNYTTSTVTVDGITVPAHSILACVEGGSDNAVAQVLYNKKTIGTGYATIYLKDMAQNYYFNMVGESWIKWESDGTSYYTSGTSLPQAGDHIYTDPECTVDYSLTIEVINGDLDTDNLVVENVIDEAYGSTYLVSFIRPIASAIDVAITVGRQGYSGADLEDAVKEAIMQWYNGDIDGVDGIKIGKAVSPFEISAAVSDVLPDIFISGVGVCAHGGTPASTTLTFGAVHKATLDKANISVTITQ